MKTGDLLVCTFQDDTGTPRTNYVAEITSIDPAAEWLSCRWVDNGENANFQYSAGASGPWPGDDGAGNDFVIETHFIYTPSAQSPGVQDVAVVTFADNRRFLCYVESIDQTTNVVFYHYPYYRISLDFDAITASDWADYGAGDRIISIERCVLNNEISANGNLGMFNQGWWSLATRRDAHPGRVGANINAFSTVVHTTDMVPESWNGLISRWTTQPGEGNGAHFVIGRDANAGVIQLVPITRNANHAGGTGAGTYVAGSQTWAPNSCSIGIELHCAGAVQNLNGSWRLVESGVPQGQSIPDADIIPDPAHAGRGWHTVTDYQYQQIDLLLNALETVLDPLPAGCVTRSIQAPPAWGVFPHARVVGHVSLTPGRRSDPWPPTCDWLRTR